MTYETDDASPDPRAEKRRLLAEYADRADRSYEAKAHRPPGLGASLESLAMTVDKLEKTAFHLIERLQPVLRLDQPREGRDSDSTKSSDGSDLRSQVTVLTRRVQDISDHLYNVVDRVDL